MLKDQAHPAGKRSKMLIVTSLLSLMQTIDYQKITITEITIKATLTRRTFYAHFKTKDEVLNYYMDELNENLLQLIKKHADRDHKTTALIYFRFWMSHSNLLRLLKSNNLLNHLFANLDKNITDIRLIYGCNLSSNNKKYADYSSMYFKSILSGMLEKWLDNNEEESAQELVDLVIDISQAFNSSLN